ncbi:hypothetical protein [Protofrankia coriariae]|uniref:Uncharacterized protein n=1 Tax=Protofrankia coriariae TaxID=1562887 RepID=A0ABR5F3U2_9ACTN|nr:hypothetical protein [Protofrankia coriariae]KLL11391.1 hypothetical protein FrCorBMG51_11570 [Protofrankia coriariae]ONH34340.1 hypothetical protein BL254_16705 [Protofrankia sp. BMG5.30]
MEALTGRRRGDLQDAGYFVGGQAIPAGQGENHLTVFAGLRLSQVAEADEPLTDDPLALLIGSGWCRTSSIVEDATVVVVRKWS